MLTFLLIKKLNIERGKISDFFDITCVENLLFFIYHFSSFIRHRMRYNIFADQNYTFGVQIFFLNVNCICCMKEPHDFCVFSFIPAISLQMDRENRIIFIMSYKFKNIGNPCLRILSWRQCVCFIVSIVCSKQIR